MLKYVKHFAGSRKVRTFALPIGRKAKQHYSTIKVYKVMKTVNFKNEVETEQAILALTAKGIKFRVAGRKSIVIL